MELSEVEKIATEAIQKRLIVEVRYKHKDGTETTRMMEPFDVAPGALSKTKELKFWGWCLSHNHIEQRTISNILSMRITDKKFNPRFLEAGGPLWTYRIPRNW